MGCALIHLVGSIGSLGDSIGRLGSLGGGSLCGGLGARAREQAGQQEQFLDHELSTRVLVGVAREGVPCNRLAKGGQRLVVWWVKRKYGVTLNEGKGRRKTTNHQIQKEIYSLTKPHRPGPGTCDETTSG